MKNQGSRESQKEEGGTRNHRRENKPDAIVIAEKDNTLCADILRRVKTNPKLCELGENVTKIRGTVSGGLLLQLRRSGKNTENLSGAIGELLGENASVRSLKDIEDN